MALWFKRKPTPEPRRECLPGDVGSVAIPSPLRCRMEDEGTLLIWVDGCDDIFIRVSSIGFTTKSGEFIAKAHLRDDARKKGLKFHEHGELGIASEEERETEQDGLKLLHRMWMVGTKNALVFVSTSIIKERCASAAVKGALQLLPGMLESIEITHHREIVRTEGGEVEVEHGTVESTAQTIRKFGAVECAWLEANESRAREMCVKYGSGGELDAQQLDQIFLRWMLDDAEKEPPDVVANALGAAFGNYIVESLGFRWVVLSDEHGAEYAVRHSVGENTAFPRASVEKRIQQKQTDFFQKIWLLLKDRVTSHTAP